MKDKSNGKSRKKTVTVIVLIAAAVLVIVIGAAIHNMTRQVEQTGSMVEIEPVQRRDLSDTISLIGSVSGESKTNVMSLAAAEVTEVRVQVGDMIAEGDTLVILDREDIEKQIKELETELTNSTVLDRYNDKDLAEALESAKTARTQTLEDAQKAVDRAQQAYDQASASRNSRIETMIAAQQNAGSEQERAQLAQQTQEYVNSSSTELSSLQQALDDAKQSYERAVLSADQSVLDAQEAIEKSAYMADGTFSQTRDTLNDLKKQLEGCELKAPCAGVVVAVNVSVGDKNTPGATMLTIEDTSALKMVATVAEADILKLQEGMSAVATSNATGEEEINGTVTRVVRVKNQSLGADASSAGYSVEIDLDNTSLLIGMDVRAKVMLKEKKGVLAVPYDLVQYDESGNAYVLVAESTGDGNARAVRKEVEIGEEVDYYVEITGGELKEGDQLIYDYTYSIVEGDTFAPEQMYSEQDLGMADGTDAEVIGQ